jgi:pectate lyase
MKKQLFTYLCCLFTVGVFAQKPNFGLVGFGSGTVGGAGGPTVTVTTYDQLAAAVAGNTPTIIMVSGTLTGPGGGVILDVGSNKSIIGIGSTAFLSMINLHLKNSQQVIIQNIKTSMVGSTLGSDADLISIETTSSNECKYIWIDHCEFFNVRPTLPETAAKKDLYDGMIDVKKSSSLITISWNYFHDHWKCNLIGYTATDTFDRKITFHHNYYKNVRSRTPSYRGGTGHIYNNFYDGLNDTINEPTSDAVNTREHACLKVESNYFRNYIYSIYTALSDVTYIGYAYGSNNVFDNSPAQTAALCNSFSPPYSVAPDKAADIPGIVVPWSGVGKLDNTAVVYKLSITTTGQGSVYMDPAGGNYIAGTTVTLTPKPASGNKFVSWSGSATGSANPTTVVVDGNKTVNANFSVVTGLEEDAAASTVGFRSYPNPVTNLVHLHFQLPESGQVAFSIKDNIGRTVISPNTSELSQGDNELSIDMSHLKPGVYYSVFQYGNTTFAKMIVKE